MEVFYIPYNSDTVGVKCGLVIASLWTDLLAKYMQHFLCLDVLILFFSKNRRWNHSSQAIGQLVELACNLWS